MAVYGPNTTFTQRLTLVAWTGYAPVYNYFPPGSHAYSYFEGNNSNGNLITVSLSVISVTGETIYTTEGGAWTSAVIVVDAAFHIPTLPDSGNYEILAGYVGVAGYETGVSPSPDSLFYPNYGNFIPAGGGPRYYPGDTYFVDRGGYFAFDVDASLPDGTGGDGTVGGDTGGDGGDGTDTYTLTLTEAYSGGCADWTPQASSCGVWEGETCACGPTAVQNTTIVTTGNNFLPVGFLPVGLFPAGYFPNVYESSIVEDVIVGGPWRTLAAPCRSGWLKQ